MTELAAIKPVVNSRPVRVLVSLDASLDREAYAARVNLEPGFHSVHSGSLAAPPDVRLASRCGSDFSDLTIATVALIHSSAAKPCDCCRTVSRAAGWTALTRALREAAGKELQSSGEDNSELSQLTRRELEVLRLVGLGKTVGQCAESLGVSPSTVGNHKYRLMRKLGVSTSLQLLRIAVRSGIADIHGPQEVDHLGVSPIGR
ncbi:Response regulator UvrY [Botrimarina colliarenosi]|uniref:Response regulator UvrY n=1 Tax=Botrimarina colliarenosi TaxID=2528001 RepID=A0A5C6AJA1_9BACT|nr:LuxR C-terminal-related transcriptional regulator [Botrimarina colliarenosi]TWU00123.1 Response regulator UvrY [Botrimarina colliarenosi]